MTVTKDISKQNVRTQRELAEDLLTIAQMRRNGSTWSQIAFHINSSRPYSLSWQTYYNQYHWANSNIEKEALDNKEALIVKELDGIDWQIRELEKAYQASIRTALTRTKTTGGKNGDILTETEREELGDPRYMAEITKLREQRARLLGIYAPEKVEHSAKIEFVLPSGRADSDKSDAIE